MYSYGKKEEDIKKGRKDSAAQRKSRQAQKSGAENRTGIPAQLKERMESHMGLSLDDVRVHYHSDMPRRLDALAYTQGNQVYIGPGQERHLPHELGHVVQQKIGNVRADTRHESGVLMNTDASLEREADEIGALSRPVGGNEKNSAKTVQRRIVPQSEQMDNGALMTAVRGRMGKKYKKEFDKEIQKFYRLMVSNEYPFTNDEILEGIVGEKNWSMRGNAEKLVGEMERKKQEELDTEYGGERGHIISRHIEISEESLRARVEGERGVPRASKFAPTAKGRRQVLAVLEKMRRLLKRVIGGVLRDTGKIIVKEMDAIKGKSGPDTKAYLLDEYGMIFDREVEEEQGEFTVSYKRLLQKSGTQNQSAYTLSVDYSVVTDRIFEKIVVEHEDAGEFRRVFEQAELYRGRMKPSIQIAYNTAERDIDELVESSGIDIVGVTFY